MEVPIQVVVRLRPHTEVDAEANLIQAAPMTSQIILGSDNIFDFDAVFTSDCSQKEIFATCIADNVLPKFFQGVNSTVLTYGHQTSGKTYTMIGPEILWAMNEEEFGILPQAIRNIFHMMSDSPKREYRVHVSYLMIHRESVYDLLLSGHPISSLNVLEDSMGNVVVPGLTVVDCTDIAEVLNCLKAGLLQRHSASTKGFDLVHAHTIFTLTLEHQWMEADGILKYIYSRISFIDLAGCDNSKSFAFNGAMRSLLPNSDLAVLRNVIQSRSVGACNVPYKDSRLTHIVKDAFGGNSLTLLICCLSPSSPDYEATYDALKICSAARSIVNRLTLNLVLHNSCQSTSMISPSNNQNTLSRPSSQPTLSQQYVQNNCYTNQDQLQSNVFVPPPSATLLHNNYPQRGSIPDVAIDSDEVFRFQFAASQWHQLVSSAENLLAEILQADGVSNADRSKIQSWLCMKAEADDCIGKDVSALPHPPESFRQLDVIEELSEPNDVTGSSSASCCSESDVSSDSSLEDEFYDQLQTLENKFNGKVIELVEKHQREFDTIERLEAILSERTHISLNKTCATEVENMSTNTESAEDMKKHASMEKISHDSSCDKDNWNDVHTSEVNYNLEKIDAENLALKCGSRDNLLASSQLSIDSLRNRRLKGDSFKKIGNSSDSLDDHDCNDSSENELIRRVSSKFLSVSKGPSKCVDSLKSKSTLLKKSIKSHIFRKRQKVTKHPENILMTSIYNKDHNCPRIGCNLKATEDRLKEIFAIINLKERFLLDLKQNRNDSANKKCEQIRSQLESELEKLTESFHIAQGELMEVNGEAERMSCRKRIDTLKKDINQLKKKIHRMQKVIAIAQNTQTKITELDESLKELRTQQEELQTQIREEVQRKQQLEQIFDSRGVRNPLCNSELLHDECQVDNKVTPSHGSTTECTNSEVLASQNKKRKFTNSPALLKEKSSRLNATHSEACTEEGDVRVQIGSLRESKLLLVHKRQKLDKKLRKNRFNEADEERRLLELDEAVEGLDLVIERLNLCITGAAPSLEECASFLQRYDLIQNLENLSVNELMHLLVKYFNKVIDLRIEFRKQEIDYRDLESQCDEQTKYIRDLTEAYRQASLEMEHRHTSMQWNYEEKISMLLRQLNDDTSGRGGDGKMKIWELEKQLFYYKELSRQLKEKLKKYSSSPQSRPVDALAGPSRIRNPRPSDASADPHLIRRERRFAIQDGGGSSQTKVTREKNKLIIHQGNRLTKSPLGDR